MWWLMLASWRSQVLIINKHHRKDAEEHHVVGGRPSDLEFYDKIDVYNIAYDDHINVLMVVVRNSVSSKNVSV